MALFQCSGCGCNESVCVRTVPGSDETRRIRRCLKCGTSYQTVEKVTYSLPSRERIERVQDEVKPAEVEEVQEPKQEEPKPTSKPPQQSRQKKKGALERAMEGTK